MALHLSFEQCYFFVIYFSRRVYIRSKYQEHKFIPKSSAIRSNDNQILQKQMILAIRNADLRALLQVLHDLPATYLPKSVDI